MDRRAYALWDLHEGDVATFADLSAKIHPKDLDRVRAAFTSTRAIVGPYEIDFRILFGEISGGSPRAARAVMSISSTMSCAASSST